MKRTLTEKLPYFLYSKDEIRDTTSFTVSFYKRKQSMRRRMILLYSFHTLMIMIYDQ